MFTPSHDPSRLRDVWDCLRNQTHTAFEWVVVANGPQAKTVAAIVKQMVGDDKRLRLLESSAKGVGALKRFACENCRGEVYLELDHDDLITPDCLSSVVDTVAHNALAFVHSDAVTCDFEGQSLPFDPAYGWRSYEWDYAGRRYTVPRTPPVTARSLCDILYAPDHVRAWTAAAYKLAGGHDANLAVGDDHELLVRTYLQGVPFHHIDRPLYLHRLNKTTTSQTRLHEIAKASQNTRNTHLHALAAEWAYRHGLPCLDLGGAHNCPIKFEPVDKNLGEATTGFRCDVFDLPRHFLDNSVGCIRAYDFLEHIPQTRIVELMNLLYRLLVPGGWLLTSTPTICDDNGRCGRGAFQDPTHLSYWSSNSTWYYTKKEFAKYCREVTCRFQTVRLFNGYPSDWHKMHLIPYMVWDACALKDDDAHYHPGPREI